MVNPGTSVPLSHLINLTMDQVRSLEKCFKKSTPENNDFNDSVSILRHLFNKDYVFQI